jgi:hypothetical protein
LKIRNFVEANLFAFGADEAVPYWYNMGDAVGAKCEEVCNEKILSFKWRRYTSMSVAGSAPEL